MKPKTLNDIRNHPLVDEVSDERLSTRDPGDGIWVYLKTGYCWGEVHSLHEDTVKALIQAWDEVTPCACAQCHANGQEAYAAQPVTGREPYQVADITDSAQHGPVCAVTDDLGDAKESAIELAYAKPGRRYQVFERTDTGHYAARDIYEVRPREIRLPESFNEVQS